MGPIQTGFLEHFLRGPVGKNHTLFIRNRNTAHKLTAFLIMESAISIGGKAGRFLTTLAVAFPDLYEPHPPESWNTPEAFNWTVKRLVAVMLKAVVERVE